MQTNSLKVSAFLLALLILPGCIMVDRSNRDNDTPRGTTIGEELEDLEEAREEGLLSQSEYERQRRRILDY